MARRGGRGCARSWRSVAVAWTRARTRTRGLGAVAGRCGAAWRAVPGALSSVARVLLGAVVLAVDDALGMGPEPDLGDGFPDLDRAAAERAGAGPAGLHDPGGEHGRGHGVASMSSRSPAWRIRSVISRRMRSVPSRVHGLDADIESLSSLPCARALPVPGSR